MAPLIEEKTSHERKLPPCRFDLRSLDLKADALPIELAGSTLVGSKISYGLCDFGKKINNSTTIDIEKGGYLSTTDTYVDRASIPI